MKSTSLFLGIFAIAGLVILLSGCNPTGWATRDVPNGTHLSPGENVTVIQNDGNSVSGTFVGLESIPTADYIKLYSSSVQPSLDGKHLPAVGQNILVSTSVTDQRAWEGQFLGFDYKSLWVRMKGQSSPQELYVSTINSMTGRNGEVFQRMALRNMFLNGDIPLMSVVVVKSTRGDVRIPISSIQNLIALSTDSPAPQVTFSMSGSSFRESLVR